DIVGAVRDRAHAGICRAGARRGLRMRLRGQQADLMRKDAELSAKYGSRHPQMIALHEEKKNLDAKIQEEVSRIIRNLASEVDVARVRLSSLEGSLRDIQGTTSTQGHASIKLRELERDAQSTRTLYDTFQSRFKETEAKGQVQTPDSRRLDRASVPGEPSFPNIVLILGLTLFGSTVLGVVIALLLERLDNGYKSGAEVERTLGIANLAVVPRIAGKALVGDRIVQKPLSSFSEAVRSVYTGLLLSNIDTPPQVVMVTSTVPGEGKTSLSVSLGRMAAKNAMRVLLIDGDFRHPSVSGQILPQLPELGLIDFLAGKCDLSQAVYDDPMSPLQFMPVVTKPSNPAGVLGSQSMKNLIEALRPHYDLIVIDAAPVLPVSDTRLLASLVDKVLYVVRWDSTPREAIASGIKLLREAGADIAGTILNRADMRQHSIYGYGYSSYGYGGHYAKYYAE
ncbi:MAG: polysaccharide biosynthesis tyrosine autokinase, partial [Micropepsaceae bacterium]